MTPYNHPYRDESEIDPDWEKEELEREFAEPERSPYACSDRMCGAPDCRTCYPSTADETYRREKCGKESEQ
jgi:hypothetical protein